MGDPAYLRIVPISAVCGIVAGFVMHRSDFCVTAPLRDLFLLRDVVMLRIWLLLVVVCMPSGSARQAKSQALQVPVPLHPAVRSRPRYTRPSTTDSAPVECRDGGVS